MTAPRILLTRRWPTRVEDRLRETYDVVLNKDDVPMTAPQIAEAMREYDAVCATVSDSLPSESFGKDLSAKIIGNFGVGVSHIDLDAAKASGVTVTNTPRCLTDCTADLAIALMLMSARRLGEGEREVRSGGWSGWRPTHMMGRSLAGKTLGIVGMGRIGIATAWRAQHGFGMDIAYYNRSMVDETKLAGLKATALPTIDEVIEASDFVSLHCPGGDENRHLLNEARIRSFGPDRFLINTARGEIVDEAALVSALESGQIGGAALDVYEKEPEVHAQLLANPKVVLLPHLGSATIETREAMGMMVADNLDAFFAGNEPPHRVL